jgi:hypothetical protein
MRKVIYGLGIAMVVLIAVGITGLIWVSTAGKALDAESKAYVDDAVVSITTHWDKGELRKRAAPELMSKLKPGELDTLFDAFENGLGPLVEYRGAKCEAIVKASIGAGSSITANYLAQAHYKNGDAEIRVTLAKADDHWRILGFLVNSNALIGNLAGRKS